MCAGVCVCVRVSVCVSVCVCSQNNALENQVDELRATNSALGRKVDSSVRCTVCHYTPTVASGAEELGGSSAAWPCSYFSSFQPCRSYLHALLPLQLHD